MSNITRDTTVGIRSMTVIKKLPVCQLTDEEICKLFFKRFDAKAMVFIYMDKDENKYCFGRLIDRKKYDSFVNLIMTRFHLTFGTAENWKEI